jgi:hypothetical protein
MDVMRLPRRLWSYTRNLVTLQSLLDIIGWRERIVSIVVAVAFSVWAYMAKLPAPFVALIGLVVFVLLVVLILVGPIIWRVMRGDQQAEANPKEATEQPPVLDSLEPQLTFCCIYSDERCPKIGLGRPQMMRVRTTQVAIANVARNTIARIEFVDRAGDRFTLPQVSWYVRKETGSGRCESFQSSADLEGGEEQGLIFLLEQQDKDGSWKAWVSRDLCMPVTWLSTGEWVAKVIVTCDNGKGFNGEIRFTILPDGRLRYAEPAFHPTSTAAIA